jgi:hypothetical protein
MLDGLYFFLCIFFLVCLGPKNRVESVIKAYHEGEYDFGIDYNVVMSITGYDIEDAKDLLAAHSKNDSGM